MNFLKTTTASIALATFASSAFAEGLERQTFSSGFLFEQGDYAEASFGIVRPDFEVTAGPATSSTTIAKGFSVASVAYKTQVSEKLSLGVKWSNGTNGVGIDYSLSSLGLALPVANVESVEVQFLGKYKVTDAFSVFGGLKHVSLSGDLNLNGTGLTMGSGSGTGGIIGVAYERPDIALRVAASYEGKIDLDLPTHVTAAGPVFGAVGDTTGGIGDAFQIEFQSGVAPNTLVFGTIRRSMWSDSQVVLPPLAGGFTVSDFGDGNSISLGVARRINDKLALSLSAYYSSGDGADASALSPQGSNKSLTLGGRYTLENGANVSVGLSHSRRGDATVAAPFNAYSFTGSTVNSLGMKISNSF